MLEWEGDGDWGYCLHGHIHRNKEHVPRNCLPVNFVEIVLSSSIEVEACSEERDEVHLKYTRLHNDRVSNYIFKVSLQKCRHIVSEVRLTNSRDDKACLYGFNLSCDLGAGVLFVCLEVLFVSGGVTGVFVVKN
jgi:hypothetical protein